MAIDQLAIYNGALLICGERHIANLTVNEEGRRLLDQVWADGGVRACLEEAQWKFAMRASKLNHETSFTAQFGYQFAFAKPADWVATSAVCQDEFFRQPCIDYNDEISYWFASIDPIYVKYVSSDKNYGTNYANWPSSFTEYVKQYFASKIILKLTSDNAKKDSILKPRTGSLDAARLIAMSRDAMAGPATRPAPGSWVRSRSGGRSGPSRDGGSTNQLIG